MWDRRQAIIPQMLYAIIRPGSSISYVITTKHHYKVELQMPTVDVVLRIMKENVRVHILFRCLTDDATLQYPTLTAMNIS